LGCGRRKLRGCDGGFRHTVSVRERRSRDHPATTKAKVAETLFFDYFRQRNLKIRVARIFNTYGPRMHPNDGWFVSNFIVQALTIYGSGSRTRAFCYVDDLIDGFVKLMAAADEVTGPINLGNPTETSVAELADLSFYDRLALHFDPPAAADRRPIQRCRDISEEAVLGWQPHTDLKKGLARTIQYFDDLLGQGRELGHTATP